ncbi:MAG: phosphorylase [Rhodocyclales bacterium]|nr:phosphorylase [Rhodocyclales bacterium]
MPTFDPNTIDATTARAERSGALQAIHTEQQSIEQAGFHFVVRWVSTLASKDLSHLAAATRADPRTNPFLPPEPDLTIGAIGTDHIAILNKFPVIPRHLLIVTRAFEDQIAPLTPRDFDALAQLMNRLGGLGFYNGGVEAGASQRHKHLQWIPEEGANASLAAFADALPEALARFDTATHPALPWQHCFVRLRGRDDDAASMTGAVLARAFSLARDTLGILGEQRPGVPYNLLVNRDWLLLLPRSQAQHQGIPVNALGFAGSLFVRQPEQIATVEQIGPLQLLAAVACARSLP